MSKSIREMTKFGPKPIDISARSPIIDLILKKALTLLQGSLRRRNLKIMSEVDVYEEV